MLLEPPQPPRPPRTVRPEDVLKRFLVVDDHRLFRKMLGTAIAAYGCEVDEAEDGAEAVEKAMRLLDAGQVSTPRHTHRAY
jgi:hypothetical protein